MSYKPGMPIEELARMYGFDEANITKLASNENPYGMSPRSRRAIAEAIEDGSRYPDQFTLRVALAEHMGIAETRLVLGNGSNDILDLIGRMFLGPGSEAISSEYSFVVYKLVTKIVGATNIVVPAVNYGHDLDAMQRAITPQTTVVWIANPNNPTGTFIDYDTIKQFVASIPRQVIIVLDEAYYEYLADEQRIDTIRWLESHPNLIIVRTFSKVYGLAGLRVGYGITSPEIADVLNRVRQPFNVNNVAIAAAVAGLADQEYVEESRSRNLQALAQLKKGLADLGLSYLPTYGNFVTVHFMDADAVNQALLRRGIIVRPLAEYGMPEYLRISCGRPDENERLLQSLRMIILQ
jgi:histidinol-phosphate aminotransferase